MSSGQTDYKDVNELIETQNAKLEDLALSLSIIKDRKHLGESITKAVNSIHNIKKKIAALRESNAEYKKIIFKISECENEFVDLDDRMTSIEKSISVSQINDINIMNGSAKHESSQIADNVDIGTPLTFPRRHLNFNDTSLTNSTKKNGRNHIGIPFINVGEFQTIPRYMLGSITCDNLNSFIEKVNLCANDKYDFIYTTKLKKKNKIPLKNNVSERFVSYQRQECDSTKGKIFITENDLKTVLNGKMDKRSSNLLTILRHTQRIRENRDNSIVKYVLNIDSVK